MILTRSSSLNRRNVPTSWHPWMWFVGSSWGLQFWDGIHQPVLVWGCRFFFLARKIGHGIAPVFLVVTYCRKASTGMLCGNSLWRLCGSGNHWARAMRLADRTWHLSHFSRTWNMLWRSHEIYKAQKGWRATASGVSKKPHARNQRWTEIIPSGLIHRASHLSGESWLIREMIPKWP